MTSWPRPGSLSRSSALGALLYMAAVTPVAAVSLLDDASMADAQAGLDLLYHGRTAEAEAAFERVRARNPESPAADFLLGGIEWHRVTTGPDGFVEGGAAEQSFFARMDAAISLGEAVLERDETDAPARFFLGGAYGYKARYLALQEKWWSAYRTGKRGVGHLETLAKEHPEIEDTYLGLGIYHYYADVLPSVIKFFAPIMGMNGDRKRGLAELKRAVRGGVLVPVEARFFLAEIDVSFEERPWSAYGWSRGLREDFPENELFVWLHARVLDELHLAEAATEEWSLLREKPRTGRVRGFLDYRLARTRLYGGDFEGAAADLDSLIEYGRLGSRRISMWGRIRYGVALDFLERHDEAMEQYRLAKDLDASDAAKARAQDRLYAGWRDPAVTSLEELEETARILAGTRGYDEATLRRVEESVTRPSRGLSPRERELYFDVLYDLALARLVRGDAQACVDAVGRAARHNVRPSKESRGKLLALSARALVRLARAEDADDAYRKAIGLTGGDLRDRLRAERELAREFGTENPGDVPSDTGVGAGSGDEPGAFLFEAPDRGELRVAVELEGDPRGPIPMQLGPAGWALALEAPAAAPLVYRFVVDTGPDRPDPQAERMVLRGDQVWCERYPKQTKSVPSE